MKRKTSIFITVLVMLLAFGITANAEGLTLSQDKVTVNVGGTVTLRTSGSDRTSVWTSYDTNLVRVSQRGQLTALRAGKTTIKVRAGKETRTCAVTVVAPSIRLDKKTATIYHGGTSAASVQLKATVKGASGEVQWGSSDKAVAVVDGNGLVTAKGVGKAVITAEANGRKASCTVKVLESSIVLNMDSLQVSTRGAGSSIKVIPTVVGSKKSVKWTTSDKSVATVSKGKVTGKKQGKAVITATANGVSASCEVTVKEGLVSISEEKVLLYSNTAKPETRQLKTNAGKKDAVTWTSSDESVAAVNNKGLVTAKGAGRAVISASCSGMTDSCEVTVKETSVNIVDDEVDVDTKGDGRTCTLETYVTGRKSSVTWKSSNPKVASVSKGKVTGKKAGYATITATANGVSDSVGVWVWAPEPAVELNADSYTLYTCKGNTVTLKAAVEGPGKKVSWSSSDPSIATVDGKGKVTAAGKGRAVITAEANGATDTCTIMVKESSVRLGSTCLKLDTGDKVTITADVTGAGQSVKWTSTNSKVASVKNGVITAKKDGKADIKATANGVTSVCHVLVDSNACDHSYNGGTIIRKPTCADTGIKTYTCTACGDNYNVDIPLTEDHDYKSVEEHKITCTAGGSITHTCRYCGYSYDEVIPAREHDYVWQNRIDASCEFDGYKVQICSVCGASGSGKTVPATGHNWGGWVVVKEATESVTGTKTRTCSVCGKTEDREIPVVSGGSGDDGSGTGESGEGGGKDPIGVRSCNCGHFDIWYTSDEGWERWDAHSHKHSANKRNVKYGLDSYTDIGWERWCDITEYKGEDPYADCACTICKEIAEDPIAVRICQCGHFMPIYTSGLSDEESEKWCAHSRKHLEKHESDSYTDEKWSDWSFVYSFHYKRDPYADCTCAICKEMSEESKESEGNGTTDGTDASDEPKESEETGATDGTDKSEDNGATDGTDEPVPVIVRVCQCGYVMMIYDNKLSSEEEITWERHITKDKAKGQYIWYYEFTYAEYLEYLERISGGTEASGETGATDGTETSDESKESGETGATDGTDASDESKESGETGATDGTETSDESKESGETGATDGTDEPVPVIVRVCDCGYVMMIYADNLSPEELAAWDEHIMEDQAKGQYNAYYDLTYEEYLEYLDRISKM